METDCKNEVQLAILPNLLPEAVALIEGKTKTVGTDWGYPEVEQLAKEARRLVRAVISRLEVSIDAN